jgi:hypothetical protein
MAAAVAVFGAPAPQSGAATTVDAVSTPTTVHGTNFLVRSQLDEDFCMAVEPGTGPGRTITLQACSTADTQRWALTWNDDDTNLLVDIQGMCVDARLRTTSQGQPASVQRCRFGDAWRFTFDTTGRIQEVKNGRCLAVPGAAANATVVFVPCDDTRPGQLWKVTR